MSTNSKYAELIDRLYIQTTSKKITWTQIHFSDSVCAKVGTYEISLEMNEGPEGPIARCEIKSENGSVVDTFTDEDLSGQVPSVDDYSAYWPLMRDLRNLAVRRATGADDALDSILDVLGKST